MLQWIQSFSWVNASVNGLKRLFGKSKPVVEEPAPAVEEPAPAVEEPAAAVEEPAGAKPAAKRPRKRRAAKPKQQ